MELPLGELPKGIDQLIYSLRLEGITPIIAHPERSVTAKNQLKEIENLIHLGALLQINAGSLLGRFGKNCKKIAECMLKQDLAHVMASDAHDPYSSSFVILSKAIKRAEKLVGKRKVEKLIGENPDKILKGVKLSVCEGNTEKNRDSLIRRVRV